MNKIAMFVLAALLAGVLACAPGAQRIPAGPEQKPFQPEETLPAQPPATPIPPQVTPAPSPLPTPAPKPEQATALREQAIGQGTVTLEQDSTFRFDGIKESVKLTGEKSLDEGRTWELFYSFESRYPGYGNRTGKIMAAVITPHKVRVVVRAGAVVEAIMDEQWDMLAQRLIDKKSP